MRTLTIVVFICSSFLTLGQSTNWAEFEKAWDKYLNKPTHDNSVKAYDLLPNKVMGGDYPKDGTTGRVFSKIGELDKLIRVGDRDALRLAFRLFTIADGEYAEGLQIEIGNLINKNPKLFLQELINHRHLIVSLGGLIGNLGQAFVDESELQKKEVEKRIKSLKQVPDKDLITVRDECLAELDRKLKRIASD